MTAEWRRSIASNREQLGEDALAAARRSGDPTESGSDIGPLASEVVEQLARVTQARRLRFGLDDAHARSQRLQIERFGPSVRGRELEPTTSRA